MSLKDRMLGRFPVPRSEQEAQQQERDLQVYFDHLAAEQLRAFRKMDRRFLQLRGKVARASKKRKNA